MYKGRCIINTCYSTIRQSTRLTYYKNTNRSFHIKTFNSIGANNTKNFIPIGANNIIFFKKNLRRLFL